MPKPSGLQELSGGEFEKQFMMMMVGHHWQAIISSADLLRNGYHHDLEEMAEYIILTQSKEIKAMRAWLCEWYGVCDWHYHGDERKD